MSGDILAYVGLFIAGLAISVFATLAEAALSATSLGRIHRLGEKDSYLGRDLEALVDGNSSHLKAIRILRWLSIVLTTLAATLLNQAAFPVVSPFVTALVVFLLIVAVGQLSVVLGPGSPEATLSRLILPIRVSRFVLWPVGRVFEWAFAAITKDSSLSESPTPAALTAEDLRELVAAGGDEGLIVEEEREMIDSILNLDARDAGEIMVPRMDIVAVDSGSTVRDAVDRIEASGYSRLPVYDGTIDHILGITYAKDLLGVLAAGRSEDPVENYLREPSVVPESKPVVELLQDLQSSKVHIAIVVDEYGGTAGLVTIEDMLEEIVGEIQDEYDAEEAKIVHGAEGEATFDATVSLHDVNEALGTQLESTDVDTIGGLVYEQLGKVPKVGDTVSVDSATVVVTAATGRRIRKVKVVKIKPDEKRASSESGSPSD
jgi:CBS domain containing-hemolysin-like protein